MSYNKNSIDEKSGKVVYNAGIVRGIVALAIGEVDGARALSGQKQGINLYIDKDGIYVDVSIVVKYGYDVPGLAYRVQQSIKQNVENMTKYKVIKVNIHVQDILFEAPQQATPIQSNEEEQEKQEQ